MEKYFIENEKYLIRPIEAGDKEQVKKLIRENKFMKKLWEKESMTDLVDSIIQSVYVDSDSSYCIVSKETGTFCGYMEISPEESEDDEGELSIRLLNEDDMYEIMKMLGDVFKKIGHKEAKSITIQYTFD